MVGSTNTVDTRILHSQWYVGLLLLVVFVRIPGLVNADDPSAQSPGFQGIAWGSALADVSQLVPVERSGRVNVYQYKERPPHFAQETVDAVKLYAIDGKFARVMIRYRGEATHTRLKQVLESRYGKNQHRPGSMIRGLNQEYSWRQEETEINLSYRGLGERGLIFIQSRILAPRFLELMSDHTH